MHLFAGKNSVPVIELLGISSQFAVVPYFQIPLDKNTDSVKVYPLYRKNGVYLFFCISVSTVDPVILCGIPSAADISLMPVFDIRVTAVRLSPAFHKPCKNSVDMPGMKITVTLNPGRDAVKRVMGKITEICIFRLIIENISVEIRIEIGKLRTQQSRVLIEQIFDAVYIVIRCVTLILRRMYSELRSKKSLLIPPQTNSGTCPL